MSSNPTSKRVALVTGANQGIGLQTAKDLLKKDADLIVLVGSRDFAKGVAAAAEVGAGAVALQIDQTDKSSIAAAAARVRAEFGRLDILINNAAILLGKPQPDASMAEITAKTQPSVVDVDEIRAVWETNVFGPLLVYQAFLPLLRESPAGRVVNVSSALGSLTLISDPAFPYRAGFTPMYPASKTALNAFTVAMALENANTRVRVNATTPGYTATALNNFSGPETLEQGAAEAVRVALLGDDCPNGTFSHATMGQLPW